MIRSSSARSQRTRLPIVVVMGVSGSGKTTIGQLLAGRRDHFMPVSLVDSQLQAVQPLRPDERGAVVDAADLPEKIVATALARLEGDSHSA